MTYALVDAIHHSDLLTAVSGTTSGIRWTIETIAGGYRLFVAGRHIATFASPLAAQALRDEFIAGVVREAKTDANQAPVKIRG